MIARIARVVALAVCLVPACGTARAGFDVVGVAETYPAYPTDNPFYYANLTSITGPPVMTGSEGRDLFGGNFGTLEGGGKLLFDDANPSPDTVSFSTAAPVTISGYSVLLAEDMPGNNSRSTTFLEVTADGVTISSGLILGVGQSYKDVYGSDFVLVTATFAAVKATNFTVTFTQNNGTYRGPRAANFVGIRAVPEPSSMALLGLGVLGFGAFARRRHGRSSA